MEIWDIYNEDRTLSGRIMERGSEFQKGAYHLVVHGCVFNAKGELLIQQRQPYKHGWPNLWDISVGGSAISGETSQTALEREIFEELGLKVDVQGVRPHLTVNYDVGFDDIYLIEKEVEISQLTLQEEEVQAAKWASLDEIVEMIEDGSFIPYYKSLITLFFEMRKQYGCHRVK